MPPVIDQPFFLCSYAVILILLSAGIAASQYSHGSRFPNQAAYNDFYNYVVDICDIGVESFVTRAQAMLVDHLRMQYGDGIADWCKTFWRDAQGRICLAHSLYAGCNNMRIENSSRSFCQRTAHCRSSSARSATTYQDLPGRGAYAKPS